MLARSSNSMTFEIQFAGLQDPAQDGVDVGRLPGEEIEGLVEQGIQGGVFIAQHQGVIGVGRGPFQPVERQFQQAGDVGSEGSLEPGDAHLFALPDQARAVGGRLPGGRARRACSGVLPALTQAAS